MNNIFSFGTLAFVAILILSPITSHAYGTSEQSAVRLSDTHVLFSITYKLGFINRASSLPLIANTSSSKDLSFTIIDNDNNETMIKTHSIILADKSKLKNKRYFLPEGSSSDFTLIVVAEIPVDDTKKHKLQITNLPFITIDQGNAVKLGKVDKNTLSEFVTPYTK